MLSIGSNIFVIKSFLKIKRVGLFKTTKILFEPNYLLNPLLNFKILKFTL